MPAIESLSRNFMRILTCVLLSATIALSGSAWSAEVSSTTSARGKKAKKCVFPKSKKRAPTWICNSDADGLVVAAVGSATKSKAGESFMEQMAVADARTHLAQKLNESAQPKTENSQDVVNTPESHSAAITKTANESLEDTKILKRSYGPNGRLYVLIGIDEAGAQKLREAASAVPAGN